MASAVQRDVFISYAGVDWNSAAWLDWVLREAGYSTVAIVILLSCHGLSILRRGGRAQLDQSGPQTRPEPLGFPRLSAVAARATELQREQHLVCVPRRLPTRVSGIPIRVGQRARSRRTPFPPCALCWPFFWQHSSHRSPYGDATDLLSLYLTAPVLLDENHAIGVVEARCLDDEVSLGIVDHCKGPRLRVIEPLFLIIGGPTRVVDQAD
jgi:hypothetical protein